MFSNHILFSDKRKSLFRGSQKSLYHDIKKNLIEEMIVDHINTFDNDFLDHYTCLLLTE